jgi:hypothetical protein
LSGEGVIRFEQRKNGSFGYWRSKQALFKLAEKTGSAGYDFAGF